jgi:hypothetical protein
MKTSYFYQIVNLVAGVVLLALLLRFFSNEAFLEWSLFTTIGGLTIQLENALSTVCSRHIVRLRYTGGGDAFVTAVSQCRRWYGVFSTSIFACLLLGGIIYFLRLQAAGFDGAWKWQWILFCCSYFITYFYAYNCCVLIASEQILVYSRINVVTRIINSLLSSGLIIGGFGVLGLSASFLSSATLGALGMKWAGAATMRREARAASPDARVPQVIDRLEIRHVAVNVGFVFVSYSLYRVGLLIDAGSGFDARSQASYGFALQVLALIVSLSSVPINMLVAPLQRAIVDAIPDNIAREMARLAVYVNGVFLVSVFALALFGPMLVPTMKSRASFPPIDDLLILGLGFFLELNILLLVNVAIACRLYGFVRPYLISAGIGLTLAVVLWLQGASVYLAFGLAPALTQLLVALPQVFKLVRRATGVTAARYLKASARFAGEVIRHPISVGLVFK